MIMLLLCCYSTFHQLLDYIATPGCPLPVWSASRTSSPSHTLSSLQICSPITLSLSLCLLRSSSLPSATKVLISISVFLCIPPPLRPSSSTNGWFGRLRLECFAFVGSLVFPYADFDK